MYEFEAILLSESYKIKNVILTWENDSFIPKKLYSCNNNKKKQTTSHVAANMSTNTIQRRENVDS